MYMWLSSTSHCSPRCRRAPTPRLGRNSGSSPIRASDAFGLAHSAAHAARRENGQCGFPRAARKTGEAGRISGTIQVLVRNRLR